jgi:hypothetical protein
VLVASTADRLVSVARSHCLGARAVCTLHQRCLACERHGDADCRPEEDTLGSTPNGSAFNANGTRLVLCADPTPKDATPRHGTCPKAQVRLAAAGCLHTAVALELSAGQARAAVPTRMQGRLTTPPPRRPTRTTLTGPGPRRYAGQRAPPEARAMARRPHLRVSRPPARPAGGPASLTAHPT